MQIAGTDRLLLMQVASVGSSLLLDGMQGRAGFSERISTVRQAGVSRLLDLVAEGPRGFVQDVPVGAGVDGLVLLRPNVVVSNGLPSASGLEGMPMRRARCEIPAGLGGMRGFRPDIRAVALGVVLGEVLGVREIVIKGLRPGEGVLVRDEGRGPYI